MSRIAIIILSFLFLTMDFHAKRKTFKSIMEEEEDQEQTQNHSNTIPNHQPSKSEPSRRSLSRPSSPWTLSPLHRPPSPTSPSLLYHCLTTLHRQDGASVLSVAISKHLVFTASESDRIHIWKQPDCITRGYIRTHRSKISTMLSYENTLFTAHNDHRVRAWSISTTKKLATLPPTNRSLFSRKPSQRQRRHHDTVMCLAVYHAEALLYSGSVDRTVKAWRLHNPSTHCCVDSFVAHDGKINAMVVNQKDGCLFTGSSDWTVKIWLRVCRDDTHALMMVLRFQSSPVNALALSTASPCYLYSGTSDGYINIWEEEEEEEEDELDEVVSAKYRHRGFLHGHRSAVLCLASVGRVTVISGSEDATIRVWRRDEQCGMSHLCMAVMEGHKGPVRCLAASMEGEEEGLGLGFLLYSGGLDRMVKVWRVKVVGKEGGGGEEGRRMGGYEMSPVLSPLWVEKRIQGMHMYSNGVSELNLCTTVKKIRG